MVPWVTLDRAPVPGGGELTLCRRGDEFAIRVNGAELMASRAHASEERMALFACERIAHLPRPRVLIGGLGLGFTLRATLDQLPKTAEVVVAELVPAVVAWVRGPLAHLAGRPLEDRRVVIREEDAAAIVRKSKGTFDALLIDIDNGPTTLARDANARLYSNQGLEFARAALAPGGVLVVWSAGPDARFAERMRRAGFRVHVTRAAANGERGGRMHTLFVGETGAAKGPRRDSPGPRSQKGGEPPKRGAKAGAPGRGPRAGGRRAASR